MSMEELSKYIVIDRDVRFGKPCIKNTRIAVGDILEWLSLGMSFSGILEDFPLLKEIHIRAALAFAANRENISRTLAVA